MATNLEQDVEALKRELTELRSDISRLADTLWKVSGNTAAKGRERARETISAFEDEVGARPLTSVATAFGVGFIIGKLLDR